MKIHYLLIFIILASLIVGCTSESSSIAKSSDTVKVPDISEEQKQSEILATVTHASVMSSTKNWDADAEKDGLLVYPDLKDANDETVKFEGVELSVDIEVWTTKYNDNFKEVKDRLVYSGKGTIDSWKDGNFMFDGGIKVPFEEIKTVSSDKEYGELTVKIHTPDGKTYEAKESMGVRIKPE